MTTIFITFQQEGWHSWPDATGRRIYLCAPHRHMFHYRVEVQVGNPDREIELHDFREWCIQDLNMSYGRSTWSQFGLDLEDNSCEDLALQMCLAVQSKFGQERWVACEVSEDGEVGARVELRAGASA